MHKKELTNNVQTKVDLKPRPNDRKMSMQHIATLLGATCCARLATMCDTLGVVGSSLKMVKYEPTTPNMSQHGATGRPSARNMLRPTMLRSLDRGLRQVNQKRG